MTFVVRRSSFVVVVLDDVVFGMLFIVCEWCYFIVFSDGMCIECFIIDFLCVEDEKCVCEDWFIFVYVYLKFGGC